MRQLYYSLVATIIWLSLLFNLEWLVDSFRLPPFLYVFIALCSVLSILVLGRYKLSMLWPLAIGVLAYAGLEFQYAYTQGGESLSTVTTGLAAVVVTILLSSLLGRRLAQLQRLLTNLMVGQSDADDQSFEHAQGVLLPRSAARTASSSLTCRIGDLNPQSAGQSGAGAVACRAVLIPRGWRYAARPGQQVCPRPRRPPVKRAVGRHCRCHAAERPFCGAAAGNITDDLQTIVAMLAVAAQEQLGVALNIGAATFPDQAITFEALVEQAEDEMVKLSPAGTQAAPQLAPMPAAIPAPVPATSESNSYHLGRASTETTKITPVG